MGEPGMVEANRSRSRGRDQRSKVPLRVLVVEDSADDALLVALELERDGYEPYYERVETPEAMRVALDRGGWDVIVADHEMPRFDALAALRVLQENGIDLPFIIVSGQIGEDTAVAAMRVGAHDYVMKGNLTRLCPVIERELREAAERRERRRHEAAFTQSEELYRSVVEQSSECIFLVDTRYKHVLEANNAFRELLGYDAPEELRGITLYDFVAHDRASVDENIRLVVQEGRRDIDERRYRHKDGTLVDVEVRANTLLDGREVMCCLSHDITERKRAEEQLGKIKESERHRMAADLHDEVLQDIVYALQEAQIAQLTAARGDNGGPNTAALKPIADALQRSVEGLREVIFELRLEENLERSFISSIESLVELKRRMSRKRFEVRLNVGEGFPGTFPARTARNLTCIVQEALNNARRHSDAKNIRVTLKIDENNIVYAEVADDGRGFDIGGARGETRTSTMRQRALDLGGELEIQSKPGLGTMVRFHAPANRLLEVDKHRERK